MKRLVLLLCLIMPTLGALGYFMWANPDDPLFRILYTGSKLLQFLIPIIWLIGWERSRLRAIRLSLAGLKGGLLFGLITLVAMLILYESLYRHTLLFNDLAAVVRDKLAGFGIQSPAQFVLFALFLSVLHSLFEEAYWRWFVYSGLREYLSMNAVLVLSALAFTAHHIVVLQVYFPGAWWLAVLPFSIGIAVGGAAWAWWFERTGSLAGAWAAHAAADIAIMTIGYDLVFQ